MLLFLILNREVGGKIFRRFPFLFFRKVGYSFGQMSETYASAYARGENDRKRF